jgi:hypothetical protein
MDDLQNGNETDVDCGGGACPACATGLACTVAADCENDVCTGNICQAPKCTDAAKNGDETDVDCGGSCPKCADKQTCISAGDCVSGHCVASVCVAASCFDKILNGSETSIDCGGLACPACDDGLACIQNADCKSNVCNASVCQMSVCNDNTKNGDETDVDCGGMTCLPCAPTRPARSLRTARATHQRRGQMAAGTDGVLNGAETDVDCGGASCVPCPNAKACFAGADCASGACNGSLCGPWAKAFGGIDHDVGMGVAVDGAGNVLLGGWVSTGMVAPGHPPSPGHRTICRAHTSSGAAIWTKILGAHGTFAAHSRRGPRGQHPLAGSYYGTRLAPQL